MILLDNTQIILSNIFATMHQGEEVNSGLLRHLVLNTYRMYKKKFENRYGELVICNDSTNYWRKDIFPEYKGNRKKSQKRSNLDWNEIFNGLKQVRDEIVENFPYRNIMVPRAEADDVIATLVKNYCKDGPIMIVSSDKDFQQLQKYPNVEQYSPTAKRKLTCDNPSAFLTEHIIRGDSSDGIPNILSDNDVFLVEDKRQKPCGKKKMTEIIGNIDEWKETENWKRNEALINLDMIPENIQTECIDQFNTQTVTDKSKILDYFVEHRMQHMLEHLQEF